MGAHRVGDRGPRERTRARALASTALAIGISFAAGLRARHARPPSRGEPRPRGIPRPSGALYGPCDTLSSALEPGRSRDPERPSRPLGGTFERLRSAAANLAAGAGLHVGAARRRVGPRGSVGASLDVALGHEPASSRLWSGPGTVAEVGRRASRDAEPGWLAERLDRRRRRRSRSRAARRAWEPGDDERSGRTPREWTGPCVGDFALGMVRVGGSGGAPRRPLVRRDIAESSRAGRDGP